MILKMSKDDVTNLAIFMRGLEDLHGKTGYTVSAYGPVLATYGDIQIMIRFDDATEEYVVDNYDE